MSDKTLSLEEQTKKCINEIKAVLDRFNMDLDVEVLLKYGRVEPKINVVPRKAKEDASKPAPEENTEQTVN